MEGSYHTGRESSSEPSRPNKFKTVASVWSHSQASEAISCHSVCRWVPHDFVGTRISGRATHVARCFMTCPPYGRLRSVTHYRHLPRLVK